MQFEICLSFSLISQERVRRDKQLSVEGDQLQVFNTVPVGDAVTSGSHDLCKHGKKG